MCCPSTPTQSVSLKVNCHLSGVILGNKARLEGAGPTADTSWDPEHAYVVSRPHHFGYISGSQPQRQRAHGAGNWEETTGRAAPVEQQQLMQTHREL